MSDATAAFPLPNDVTAEERAMARNLIGRYTKVLADEPPAISFAGKWIGQTGPIWHFQYLRMYQLPRGYMIAGHDLREGIRVGYADDAAGLPRCFDHPAVQEFVEDELRFRGVLAPEQTAAP